jgi:RNA polymerase sigma-70 factor (ECF subfamily)
MDNGKLLKLIQKAQSGDEQAFGEIYNELAAPIYKFISFKTSDPEEAEDLLQQVFMKVWAGLGKLSLHDLHFTAWIYTIAGNTIRDHFRKVYRRPQTVSLDPALDIASKEDSSRAVSSSLDGVLVQAALEKLPPEYKQVLELRFMQELSIVETAKALGKSSVATRVLQHRAMKKLEYIFKNHERT